MEKGKIEHFKNKLLNEKKHVEMLIDQLKENDMLNQEREIYTELSYYDNHPADTATELEQLEKGLALEKNELIILNKIDDSLAKIEEGTFGKCNRCGKPIPEERLEFLPYAEFCVKCQSELNDHLPMERNNRPVEEVVLGRPFGYGFEDYEDHVEFDAEDSYEKVDMFNMLGYTQEEYHGPGYVEPIEKISNAQYKAQLPD